MIIIFEYLTIEGKLSLKHKKKIRNSILFLRKNDFTHLQADILTLTVNGSLLSSEEYLVFSVPTENLENEEQKLL